MRVSRGKDFETEIRKAFSECHDISLDRFLDPMAGYAGVRNICDFGIFKCPYQYYLECKAFSGNTLNFQSGITQNQWDGLLEKSSIPGVMAGILIWFIEHDRTVFVPIQELKRLRDSGAKSLNIKDILEDKVIYTDFPGTKKRIMFTYDARAFMHEMKKKAIKHWR